MLPIMRTRNSFPTFADSFLSNNVLNDFWNENKNQFSPAVNIKDNEKNFVIEIAAPGLNKKDFSVKIDDEILIISYQNETKKNDEKIAENYLRKEFSSQSFEKRFSLPDSVEGDKVSASYHDGILFVQVPKMKEKTKLSRLISIS